jgi:hypothetical protein
MEARKGDRLIVEGEKLGQRRRTGKVIGAEGNPSQQRLWVRWEDGHESLFIPGPGARVERTGKGSKR